MHKNTSYDLIANIVHDGEPNKGTYRVHVLKQGNSKWYEMQDLHVNDILPQMITLTEAYIQVIIILFIIIISFIDCYYSCMLFNFYTTPPFFG